MATQTEVTVAPNNNNNDDESKKINRIITNASAFSERRDLKKWAQMGSLTF